MTQRLYSVGLKAERFRAFEPLDGIGELNNISNLDERAMACYRSHYELLLKILKGKEKHVLILEDDAKFCEGFIDKLASLLSELPEDFDLCYLGASDDNTQWKLRMKGFDTLCLADHQWCLHGYLINKKCIKTILEKAKTMYAAIDQVFVELQPFLNTYATHPYLIHQDGSKSDLR